MHMHVKTQKTYIIKIKFTGTNEDLKIILYDKNSVYL